MALQIPIDQNKIEAFCKKWKIIELSFFGSVLRDDFRPDSDVDVLVTFAPESHWTLFDLLHAEEEFSQMLGRKVDLGEKSAIEQTRNYIIRRHILSTAQRIYAA